MKNKFTKLLKKVMAGLSLSTCLFLSAPSALAMPDILPLDEVTEGMTGIAYTVVDASREMRTFDVRIIGTIAGGKGDTRYILAEASGPLVDETNGIIQGMSGSPVYVDGRLVGAASASYAGMSHRTFLITPIEDMLKIWEFPDTKHIVKSKLIDLKAIAEEKAKKEAAEAEKAKKEAGEKEAKPAEAVTEETKNTEAAAAEAKPAEAVAEEAKEAEPAAVEAKAAEPAAEPEKAAVEQEKVAEPSEKVKKEKKSRKEKKAEKAQPAEKVEEAAQPAEAEQVQPEDNKNLPEQAEAKLVLSASGFGHAGMRYLEEKLSPLGYKAEIGLGANADIRTEYNAQLEPGGAFAATLLCGDFTLGATGTVTAVDDKRILGFGHPFLHRGNVNYFMTDAEIIGTVSSLTDGRKIGNIGNIIGRVSQDRGAGVAGILGVFPTVVPVTVTVEDSTLGRKETFRAKAAYDEDTLPALMSSVGYASLARTVDDGACSTVTTHFVVKTNALEKGTVERRNMFYADADTGKNAFNELQNALALIVSDKEKQSDIFDINVEVSSVAERRTASIVNVVADRITVKPGEKVNFTITLKPYRADEVKVKLEYTVPKERYEGPMKLDFHGGGMISLAQLMEALQGVLDSNDADKAVKTAEQLEKFEKAPANNEIVVEVGTPPIMSDKEMDKMIKRAIKAAKAAQERGGDEEEEELPEPKVTTDYVIDNVAHATLQIEKP